MKRVLIKYLILFSVPLLFNGCFVDVIENPEIITSSSSDITSLTKNIDLNNYPKVKEYTDFPIVAWYSIPDSALNYERFLEAKEAGITLSLFEYSNADNVQKALNLAQKVGIKVLIACPELEKETEKTVNKFKDHPANGGYFLKDEPFESNIPHLSNLAKKIEALDSTRFCYINLFPHHAQTHNILYKSYEVFVQKFVNEIPLKILSFDHYPILGNYISPYWYQNLEIIDEVARNAKIPFWAFALTSAHWGYPIPTIDHLRLQVYSNLAYGAKGIQYFTYWIPKNTIYNSAPIDRSGNKTNEYYILKEMNNEINNLSYIYQTSKVKKVSHYGEAILGTESLSSLPFYIKSLNIIGGNALFSEMENDENRYYMIQNTNLYKDIEIDVKADLLSNIILKNGSIIPASFIDEKFKLTPGDMIIFSRSLN
jgi:hypothetical protein